MKYLVCERRQARYDKAVIYIDEKCWPSSDYACRFSSVTAR